MTHDPPPEPTALPEARLEALIRAGVELVRAQDLDALLRRILDLATTHVDAERGAIFVRDAARGDLVSHVFHGQELTRLVVRAGRGIAGEVVATGRAVRVQDAYRDPRFDRTLDESTGFHTRSLLAVPLRTRGGDALGVLEVLNKRRQGAFDAADEAFLTALAAYAAVAIENASLLEERLQAERLATVGRLASALVHDLSAPLSAVRGYADVLEQEPPAEVRRRCTSGIRRQADRMAEMVRSILAFVRGDHPFLPAKVDVDALLTELAEDLEAAHADARIHVERLPGRAGAAYVDPAAIRRALENLARNAAQAMPRGGTLRLGASRVGDELELLVADTGLGMDEATRERIFEPFFTRGKPDGTGLGLAIVRRVVDGHAGRVEVESQPGRGTTFRLLLPARSS